jgi:hypothetical protein
MTLGFAAARALPLTGLDLRAARWGISRDVDELRSAHAFGWTVISIGLALPVGALVLVLFAKSLLALVPLAISAGLFGLWVLYYATDWFSNPGQGAWMPAFSLVLLGWIVLLVGAGQAFRRGEGVRRYGPATDPSSREEHVPLV